MLKCNHKKYSNNVLLNEEIHLETETLSSITKRKLDKIIIKLKELKLTEGAYPMVDEQIDLIEYDIKTLDKQLYVTRKYKMHNNFFEYKINLKKGRVHIYKSFNNKEYVSVRDYFTE